MSLSTTHLNQPVDFEFSTRLHINSHILELICKHCTVKRIYENNNKMHACPETGLYTWFGINCWVYNQEKQGFTILYFKSIFDYNFLIETFNLLSKKVIDKIKNKLYRYSEKTGWVLTETYSEFQEKYFIDNNNYFESIEKDINNHKKNSSFLKSIGEYKSLSYLLYGVPGTGKTTLIKSLSSKYNMDVYVINSITVKSENIASILNPGKNSAKNVLLLFEDFDRFLESDDTKQLMGQILNAMDGFDDTSNTIRFFTGNNCDIIFQEKALINRISGKYKFDYPDSEMFRNKLNKLLSITDIDLEASIERIDQFISLIVDKNITLRPFTAYCVRYLFNEYFFDKIVENINDLLECA
jgi:AAA+ superfamily predicted ATPase